MDERRDHWLGLPVFQRAREGGGVRAALQEEAKDSPRGYSSRDSAIYPALDCALSGREHARTNLGANASQFTAQVGTALPRAVGRRNTGGNGSSL